MSTQPLDYAAIIADLEAKKAAIESTIISIRQAMASGVLGLSQGGDVPSGVPGGSSLSMYSGDIPAGAFLGKSIPEAARIYLEIVKRKQTSREIAEALQKGGMESTSNNFVGIVHAVLDRSRKAPNALIVKLGSQWGLAGWYPKGILNSVTSAPVSKKKGKKGKKTKGNGKSSDNKEILALPAASETAHQEKPGGEPALGMRAQIVELLKSTPGEEFSAEVLSEKFGQKVQVTRMVMGKLITDGVVQKTQGGGYRASGQNAVA
jgi:hypothetical protein